jgi:hypothetical protein
MARTRIVLSVRVAWWLRPYVWACAHWCRLTGRDPSWRSVSAVCTRAIRIRSR